MIVIMIDGREKRNCEGGFQNFRVRMFVKSAVTSLKIVYKDAFECVPNSNPANRFCSSVSQMYLQMVKGVL